MNKHGIGTSTSTCATIPFTTKRQLVIAADIAKAEGISERRARLLFKEGRIVGAFRAGKTWFAAAPYRIEPPLDTGRRRVLFRKDAIRGMLADAADLQAQVDRNEGAAIRAIGWPSTRPYFLNIMGGDYNDFTPEEMIMALGFAAAMLESEDEP